MLPTVSTASITICSRLGEMSWYRGRVCSNFYSIMCPSSFNWRLAWSYESALVITPFYANKYVGPPYCQAETYACRAHAAPWWVTVSIPTGQTNRRTDGRTPDRYITLSATHGQC